MTILVTGSAGRIGSKVVRRVLGDGHAVTGFDLNPARIAHPRYREVTGPFDDRVAAADAVQPGNRLDALYHLERQHLDVVHGRDDGGRRAGARHVDSLLPLAAERRAALAAMRDPEFQRFLGHVVAPPAAPRTGSGRCTARTPRWFRRP